MHSGRVSGGILSSKSVSFSTVTCCIWRIHLSSELCLQKLWPFTKQTTFITGSIRQPFPPILHQYRRFTLYASALCFACHILVLISAQLHPHHNDARRSCIFSRMPMKQTAHAAMVSECHSSGTRNLTADLGCENLHKQPSQDRKPFILRRHRLRNLHTLGP